MTAVNVTVSDNAAAHRFEARVPGEQGLGLAYYTAVGDSIVFTHTEVPETIEGEGVASELIRWALEHVRAQGKSVVPMCPFVAAYIARHPEYRPLVQHNVRAALGG